jgi:hypothetical protein
MPHNPFSIVETSDFRESLRELQLSHQHNDDLLAGVLFIDLPTQLVP